MSVRRKYSLPGCTLILEGLTTPGTSASGTNRPLISAIVNAEVQFVGQPQTLMGGQALLQDLIETINGYAQSFLSGLPNLTPPRAVQLEPIGEQRHRLTVQPEVLDTATHTQPVAIELTTLQLFDLLESLDQMLADQRTLPDWSLQLQPLTRHQASTEEPIVKRAAPAALGVSSLAIAASILFFLPIPSVRRPAEPEPTTTEQTSGSASTQNSSGTPPQDKPNATAPTSESPTSDRVKEGTEDTDGDASTANTNDPIGTAKAQKSDQEGDRSNPQTPETGKRETAETTQTAELDLDAVPEITDPDRLYALEFKVKQDLLEAWGRDNQPEQDLSYRVSIGQDGAILGYRSLNAASESAANTTPLKELVYVPTEGGRAEVERLADFRVIFTSRGSVQVSPWDGYTKDPSAPPSITNASAVEPMLDQARELLYDQWQTEPTAEPTFDQNLEYRVGFTSDGTIAKVEPQNSAASRYYDAVPLDELYEPDAAITMKEGAVALVPLIELRVVFTPRGVIEISPWYAVQ